jgi:type I restriction enzyme M protein
VLFVQHILGELAAGGRCAIVLDDGFLFRNDESAFVETKRKLVDECDLWAIARLPVGVFVGAGATVNTNLLFFTKGRKTEKIWYYDLSDLSVGKKSPLTLGHFGWSRNGEALDDVDLPAALTKTWKEDEGNESDRFPSFARLLTARGTPACQSRYSWTVDFAARRKQAREDMEPYMQSSERAKAEVVFLKEKLKAVKAANPKDPVIAKLETHIQEQGKIARDAQASADAIDAAVFDLKAVNPNAVVKIDSRSPEEVIKSISDQGEVVAQGLKTLRMLLQA